MICYVLHNDCRWILPSAWLRQATGRTASQSSRPPPRSDNYGILILGKLIFATECLSPGPTHHAFLAISRAVQRPCIPPRTTRVSNAFSDYRYAAAWITYPTDSVAAYPPNTPEHRRTKTHITNGRSWHRSLTPSRFARSNDCLCRSVSLV